MDWKQKQELGYIYSNFLSIIAQNSIVSPYSLAYAIDEYIAFLGGDSNASTYLGFTVNRGASDIQRIEGVLERLDRLVEEVDT